MIIVDSWSRHIRYICWINWLMDLINVTLLYSDIISCFFILFTFQLEHVYFLLHLKLFLDLFFNLLFYLFHFVFIINTYFTTFYIFTCAFVSEVWISRAKLITLRIRHPANFTRELFRQSKILFGLCIVWLIRWWKFTSISFSLCIKVLFYMELLVWNSKIATATGMKWTYTFPSLFICKPWFFTWILVAAFNLTLLSIIALIPIFRVNVLFIKMIIIKHVNNNFLLYFLCWLWWHRWWFLTSFRVSNFFVCIIFNFINLSYLNLWLLGFFFHFTWNLNYFIIALFFVSWFNLVRWLIWTSFERSCDWFHWFLIMHNIITTGCSIKCYIIFRGLVFCFRALILVIIFITLLISLFIWSIFIFTIRIQE